MLLDKVILQIKRSMMDQRDMGHQVVLGAVDEFGTHCFRIGIASTAAKLDVPQGTIQQIGR